jgi:hypothetical protein
MKWLMVAMVLIGSMVGQTKQVSDSAAVPKPPSIKIGIDLQLGMSRDAILPQLAARYKVVKIRGDDDDWMVEEKELPMPTVGQLGFTAGKLSYASRIWTQGQGDNYAFAQALWGAMSQMDREDQHACFFEVPATRSPAAEMRYVKLYCGLKKIDIAAINVFDGTGKRHYTSISEVLSSAEEPTAKSTRH